MFKKTLLALALTGVASVANAAIMVPASTANISIEGSVGAASLATGDVTTTLKAEYTVGDTITFTISGAEFLTTSTPALTFTLAGATGSAQAGLLSVTATTMTFRVTSVTSAASETATFTDGTAKLENVKLKTTSAASAGKVELSYAAATSTGIALDTGTKAVVYANKVAQFGSSVTRKLDAVVDVENARKQFTKGNDTVTTDTLVITPTEAVAELNDAKYTGATHVIKGDFSWMESDGTAGISAAELAAALTIVGGDSTAESVVAGKDTYKAVINDTATEITVTVTDSSATTDAVVEPLTATFTVLGKDDAKAPILQTPTFTVDSVIKYETATASTAASKATKTDEDAGSWTLNGFSEDIPFMPFTSDYFQSISVANTGDIESTITVDITANGKTKTHELVAKATPKAITNISKEVSDFATVTDGIDGNAHVKVIVNSPAKDISVTGIFFHKSDKDRVKTN